MPDEFVLLCETCGYEIEGMPTDAACPECGRSTVESKPESRPGSPWQQRSDEAGLLRTWHQTLTTSHWLFSRARPDVITVSRLRRASLLTAAAVPVLSVALGRVFTGLVGGERGSRPVTHPTQAHNIASEGPLIIAGLAAAFFGAWGVLALLTLIEERGIRFWGPRRGWRITPAIARTICAHASVGWVLGSVLMVAGHLLGLLLADIPNRHNLGIFRGPMQLAPITLPALGFVVGMLTFEVLVYIGMSRMKFANRERPPEVPAASTPPLDALMPPASMPSPSITQPSETSAQP